MVNKSLIVCVSVHQNCTLKIAKAMSNALDADIKTPSKTKDISKYDLIGFGSGIYDYTHHKSLLNFVDKLPVVKNKKAFIFSTSGIRKDSKVFSFVTSKYHDALRTKLESKGYNVLDEFNCLGLDTNSVLKYIGGLNKGRPNLDDLKNAKEFVLNLKK